MSSPKDGLSIHIDSPPVNSPPDPVKVTDLVEEQNNITNNSP